MTAPASRRRSEKPERPDIVEPDPKAVVSGAAVDLSGRDPEFIRRQMPIMWLLATLYFRGEVRGLERIPEEGPVLFVGNHSGGNMTPDSMAFLLAYNRQFGMERPIYVLAHSLVTALPVVGRISRKLGIVTAGPRAGEAVLAAGADLLVYPGGDRETHRPWTAHDEIRFGHRRGFLRLARDAGVPIVPVVSSGGQETFLPLADGRRIARALRLDRLARLKVVPVSLALPWGLNVGDMLGHLPLPAKIRIEVLPPVDVVKRFGKRGAASNEAYRYVTGKMQEALTSLAGERVLPGL